MYGLTVAKSGSKLLPFKEGSCIAVDFTKPPIPPPPPGQRNCDAVVGGRRGSNTKLEAQAITLDYFSKLLSLVLDRPVIDKTGVSGKFDFHLSYLVDETTPGAFGPEFGRPSDDPPAASIFTALQEQLGLKLEPAKGELVSSSSSITWSGLPRIDDRCKMTGTIFNIGSSSFVRVGSLNSK